MRPRPPAGPPPSLCPIGMSLADWEMSWDMVQQDPAEAFQGQDNEWDVRSRSQSIQRVKPPKRKKKKSQAKKDKDAAIYRAKRAMWGRSQAADQTDQEGHCTEAPLDQPWDGSENAWLQYPAEEPAMEDRQEDDRQARRSPGASVSSEE